MDIQPDDADQAQPRPIKLNARYIYNKLRTEFFDNGSRNSRMVPVLFPQTGATYTHVPDCMKSTLVFPFPQHRDKVVTMILGQSADSIDVR